MQEIGWGHNILIMESQRNALAREFYIKSTIREGWSRSSLERAIKSQAYENWAVSQTNFDNQLDKNLVEKSRFLVKDEYNLDFLELTEKHTERQLEDALVENIVKFLCEMGGNLSFLGRQFKIVVDDQEFFIDLLFYHRDLKSLIAVELKAEKFKPEHSGKMAFYLAALDDQVKKEDENPSLGIIICKGKKRTIVEYALKNINQAVGIATYRFKDLPKNVAKFLPSEEEIKKRLS